VNRRRTVPRKCLPDGISDIADPAFLESSLTLSPTARALPLSALAVANITTKKANNRVTKSA
jgi:hypothetical protein